MTEFKLIVAGGRDFGDYAKLSDAIMEIANEAYADRAVSIVSGMARGADSLAVQFAYAHGVQLHEMPANWNEYGRRAGFKRNGEMAAFADGLLAFWDGRSAGTRHMIDTMRQLGKPVFVVHY